VASAKAGPAAKPARNVTSKTNARIETLLPPPNAPVGADALP